MQKKTHLLIVEARYYQHLADALLEGATSALAKAGATHDLMSVPGALEIPGIISHAARTQTYDGYVALGCVIRGETYHFDIVANESCRGLMDLTIKQHLAIGNGILTVENEAQALVRAKIDQLDRGGFAARAALAVINIQRHLGAKM